MTFYKLPIFQNSKTEINVHNYISHVIQAQYVHFSERLSIVKLLLLMFFANG